MKKNLKWIIPVCIGLLAVAAVLLVLLIGGGQKPETEPELIVGWNVDKDAYWDETLKASTRMKGGEYYRVRFAVGGKQIDVFVDDYEMINTIDSQKFVGLQVDENNVVTQIFKPHKIGGGLAVYQYYIVEIQENLLICNNVASGKGLPLKLKINENTQVYDVGGEGLLVGMPTQLQVGCQIYGVFGTDGYVSHIFSMPPFEPDPVYWNVNRMYNTSAKVTTRERDAAGFFHYDFVVDGEAVALRTRDVKVANKIDAFGAKCMCLEFDEEGLICDAVHAKYATGGSSIASWYHVLRIDSVEGSNDINVVSNGFYAEKFSGSDKGSTAECTLAENVKIYDMSGTGAYIGAPTQLQLYDQVHCLTNPYGDVCIIFIISRLVETELYYNLDRKWNDAAKISTRAKAGDGYYYFDMSVNGQKVCLKTADETIVATIDGRAARVLGLTLDGNVITGAYTPGQVMGSNKTVFDYCDVTDIAEDGTVTATRKGQYYTGVITENTKVYNVSAVASQKGEATTIRVGDKLYGFADFEGNVTTVYVVSRQMPGPVYWNLDRSYDSAKQVTKRQPAEDGYYYLKFFDGKNTVTYKTNNKSLVNKIDSMVAVALSRNGDVITGAAKYDTVKGYTGGGFASWYTVKSLNGSAVTAGNSTTSVSGIMVPGCPVYNVSRGSEAPVTKTSLRIGDRIHGIKNSDGQVVVIYVVGRTVDVELYYNLERKWDSEKAITTRVPDEDGWYWFDMSVNAQHVKVKTKELFLANAIDERSARVLGLELKGDEILAVYKPGSVKTSGTTVFDYTVVTQVTKDGVITATRNDKTFTGTLSPNAKVFYVASTAATVGEFTTVEVGDTIYGLGTGSKNVNYVYVTKRPYKTQTKTALCSVCNKEVQWTSWDGNSNLKEGHWYLTQNMTAGATVNVIGENTVCLDLCGMELSGKKTVERIFNIYGTLNLMDSVGTGKVVANYSNENGRTGSVFYVQNSKDNGFGVMNLYGGTLTSTGNTKKGGIGGIANEFNMYGGTITGGKAVQGGNLFLENSTTAKLTIMGGSITGGSADQGADIYCRKGLTVSGAVKIGELFLESGVTVSVDGLTEGASIGVTLEDIYGIFATGAVEADAVRFQAAEALTVEFAEGKLSIPNLTPPVLPEDHAAHCICGGLGAVGNHTCGEEAPVWEVWDGTWDSGKYYCLTEDFQLQSTILIEEGKTLNLCLNGYDIIGAENVTRIFNVYGVLNLCDHADETGNYAGDVISNYDAAGGNTQTGRVFYVQNKANAAFNLFGGNLKSNSKTNKGAVGGSAKTFNMYGGTITGGEALISGGSLQIDGGTTSIYGGSISGGKALEGDNIYVSGGSLYVLGGSITGGKDVHLSAKAAMTVGGDAKIGNVYLPAGKTISINELGENASVGVTLESIYGTFATGAVEADAERFQAAQDLTVEYSGGNLSIPDPTTPEEPEGHVDHCVCGGLGKIADHICEEALVWEAWTGTWESGKYYYLTDKYTLTETILIEAGQTLNLCLNGFAFEGAADVNRMFNVYGVLNICDHKDEHGNYSGRVVGNYDPANGNLKTGSVFYVQNRTNAVFNLYGGTLTCTTTMTNGGIGGLSGAFKMYDGTITGGKVTGKGGNLMLESVNAKVFVYGGTITAGVAADGGNVYIKGIGNLTVDGGTISGGLDNGVKNATNGGNVYVEKGSLNLVSGTISGGYASNAGGSVRVQGEGVLNISGGTLTGGYAKGNGGNVYSIGTIAITGGTVSDGAVSSGKIGGNIYASGGSLSISDDPALEGQPAITGGTATTGGNLAIKVNATVADCIISGGTATTGANVYFEKADGVLTLSGLMETTVYVKSGSLDITGLDPESDVKEDA